MKAKFNKKEIPKIAQNILDKIVKTKNNKAKILALSGELGAGKTTLTQSFAKHLGVKEKIVSPTFVIMKFYNIGSKSIYYSSFKKLIHIDAYRLESSLELLKIGWEEIIENNDNLIIIEWPEKVKKIIPPTVFNISLSHIDEETRLIEFL
ncbi:MAG: tRNA (adenosine(37)-N6)-threonylcarbamoyltransferase complex ATPase subunit type 1 TsaE [Candidatus Paceibacterota bacterium]|jgi:tRNA threonylcarbamoyladenosine biosynthesis protein TsaE